MSSVYDCIISSLEYTTLANLFTFVSSTLKWGERGKEEIAIFRDPVDFQKKLSTLKCGEGGMCHDAP